MISSLRQRLAREEQGFTLIELLVVIIIIGILLAIAVPSYLGFRSRANDAAAKANVRTVVPSVEAYFSDNGTYVGMTPTNLKSTYDSGINIANYAIPTAQLTATSYCVQSTVNGTTTFKKAGPGADIVSGTC